MRVCVCKVAVEHSLTLNAAASIVQALALELKEVAFCGLPHTPPQITKYANAFRNELVAWR